MEDLTQCDKPKPRWLLDTHEWRIVLYTEVASQVESADEGYGIVSYTWGLALGYSDNYTLDPGRCQEDNEQYWQPLYLVGLDVCSVGGPEWDEANYPYDEAGAGRGGCKTSATERWLLSGWTLQEGIMLSETRLIDGAGHTLNNDRFIHGGKARVVNLTDVITGLATEIGKAFVNQADGKEPQSQIDKAIRGSTENSEKLLDVLIQFVKSGLVSYAKDSALYILAGKKKRYFSRPLDECWALLGAMGIDDVQVSYTLSMWESKTIFLRALIRKFQWSMLLLPDPSPATQTAFKWLQLVDGDVTPIGIFVDSMVGWKTCLSYHIRVADKVRLISSTTATQEDKEILSQAVYLPMEDLEIREECVGKRCVVIQGFYKPPQRGEVGVYRGTIDIWCKNAVEIVAGSLQLDPTL
ncbi:heterokaryon incompatibility protein het-6-like protein [Penicillium hordei]|uniref:Heterokaryon incompatibility protein het-6-like protein n=1 Tax=Penicillium hordei TaxID=40994 RepID=A0AAD6EDE2_9EURO|nr:heterokaryon incompatibility protein het-6-like protein [Penicillium hordei]KAJ5615053.1 heterokaryon incompatibility protein het-6-like protein [Penicillium hordei]